MSKDKKLRFGSAKAAAEKLESGFGNSTLVLPDGVKMFRLKSDKSVRIDIIPFIAGEGNPQADKGTPYWERTYFMHRGIGANAEAVVCLARSFKKKCPVCQHVHEMQRSSSADEKSIKDLQPKQRQLFNVIDTNNREEGIQIWDVAPFNFGELLNKMITDSEEDEGWDTFFHPDKGATLKLTIKEETMGEGNKFFKVVGISLVPRKKQYKESIVAKAPCLDDVVKELDYDDLKAKLEEAEPGSRFNDSKKKKKKKDESDSDEEKHKKGSDSDSDSDGDSDADKNGSDSDFDVSSDSDDTSDSDSDATSDSDSDSDGDPKDNDEDKSSDSDSDVDSDSDKDSDSDSDEESDSDSDRN